MSVAPSAADAGWAGAERTLNAEEVGRRIRAARWGILAVVDGVRPYAVPMAYGFDGRRFFVATGPGRKRRALEDNPRVCLTILTGRDEAEPPGYVVVLGRVSPVSSYLWRLRAGLLILRRFSHGGIPSLTDLRRMVEGHVFLIDPYEVVGRAHTG